MTTISTLQQSRMKEAQHKKHNYEMRKLRDEHSDKYSELVKKKEKEIKNVQKEYRNKMDDEKTKLEKKLTTLRSNHKQRFLDEQQRLDQELANLKIIAADRRNEVLKQNELEILSMNEDHQDYLETAKRKFEKEKNKYKT